MKTDLEQGQFYYDFKGLNDLRSKASGNEKQAIRETAQQFAAVFYQIMLQNMRKADEPFQSDLYDQKTVNFYQSMYDEQLSIQLATHDDTGLVDMVVRDLTASESNTNDMSGASTTSDIDALKARTINVSTPVHHTSAAQTMDSQSGNEHSYGESHQKGIHGPIEFVKALWPHAVKFAKQIGLNPKILVAQAALETGWGRGLLKGAHGDESHNLFNIKASHDWDGRTVTKKVHEYREGHLVKQRQDFRSYESFEKSIADYVDFLQSNPRYQNALKIASDPKEFVSELKRAGYATDPQYSSKVMHVFHSDELAHALACLGIDQ